LRRLNPSTLIFVRVERLRLGRRPNTLIAWDTHRNDTSSVELLVERQPELCRGIVGVLSWGEKPPLTLKKLRPGKDVALLVVSCAVPGHPLRERTIDPRKAPALCEFLLKLAIHRNIEPPSELRTQLRELGLYLPQDRLPRWPRFICRARSGRQNVADQLELNPTIRVQRAETPPPEANPRQMLKSRVLDPRRPIFWREDLPSGVMHPVWVPKAAAAAMDQLLEGDLSPGALGLADRRQLVAAGLLLPKGNAQRLLRERRARLKRAGAKLRDQGYLIERSALPTLFLQCLCRYLRELRSQGYFRLGDPQCSGRLSIKDEPIVAAAHSSFGRMLQSMLGQPVLPSPSAFHLYRAGAVVERHTDRAEMKWNVAVAIDRTPGNAARAKVSPLKLELRGGAIAEVDLFPGDIVVYSGTDTPHWRDKLKGPAELGLASYHFVDQSHVGPRS
jgi:hypothetical protein